MVGYIKSTPEKRKTPGKKFGTITYKKGGRVKKNIGGRMTQGYDARLDESLSERHPGARGSLAGRRAMSKGMEKALGRGAYSGARTMSAKGGRVKAMHGGMKTKKKSTKMQNTKFRAMAHKIKNMKKGPSY